MKRFIRNSSVISGSISNGRLESMLPKIVDWAQEVITDEIKQATGADAVVFDSDESVLSTVHFELTIQFGPRDMCEEFLGYVDGDDGKATNWADIKHNLAYYIAEFVDRVVSRATAEGLLT